MSLSRLAARLPATVAWVVSHPVELTSRTVGFAKGVVAGGVRVAGRRADPASDRAPQPGTERAATEDQVTTSQVTDQGYVPPPPRREPPETEPVDVVEQALAAEEAGPDPVRLGGPATEPHPVTRDEVHGEAPLVREERDEIDEEIAEGLSQDDLDPAEPR